MSTYISSIRSIFFLVAFMTIGNSGFSQNLVPNPDFEIFTSCPEGFGEGGPLLCPPWRNGSLATADFFNACAFLPEVSVPDNYFGSQNPRSGESYTGIIVLWPELLWREYLQVQLTEPMVEGHLYQIDYYISNGDMFCGIENMGVYISEEPPPTFSVGTLGVEPQLEANMGFLTDKENWVLISDCYLAEGGEQWITIGNYYDDGDSPPDPSCTDPDPVAYYYVEDVSVMEITISTLPLELGEPVITCTPYEIESGVEDVTYLWSDGSTDPTLTVTQSGIYSLTITDGCEIGTDEVEIIFDGVPFDVDLGPEEIVICEGDVYEISLDPDHGEYEWQDGSIGPNYSITTPGIYQVSMNDGCDVTSDMIEVSLLDIPMFTLGDDFSLCPGEEFEFDFDPDLGDFQWQDNSTSPIYLITMEGDYELSISNMCGEFSDQLVVTEIELPEVELGPLISFCDGDYYEIILDEESGDFLWEDGSTSFFYSISSPGIYYVTVTNECGSVVDSVEAIVNEPPAFSLPSDQILCPGQTITLDVSGVAGDYTWQDGSTASTYLVSSEGLYAVTITNDCGSSSDAIQVSYVGVLAAPDLGPDISLCPGEEYVFYANTPGVNYTWQDGSSADSLMVDAAGSYWLQISNMCSSSSDTVNVIVENNPPVIDLPASVSLCDNATVTIDAGISGVSYLWSDGSVLPSITVSSSGAYSLTVSNSCGTDVDTVNVISAGPSPFVDLGNDVSICNGDVIDLSPVSSNVNSWLWSDGSTASTYNISQPGIISVEVSNNCGFFTDTINVFLLPDIPPINLGADTSLCPGESFILTINSPNVAILWSDGSTLSDLQVSSPGLVFATITNQCESASDSILVTALSAIPPLDLGIDQSLCPGEVIILSPGISNVDYLWSGGSTSPTFTATQAGTIMLTISNDCGVSSDTVIITENTEGPQVNIGPDILACEGETVTLSSDISGVDYLWQDGSTQSDITTTTSGTFILQVSNACGQDADTVIVDIMGTVPTPYLGPDTLLCDGESLQLISMADAITSIQWQDGSTLPVFNVTSTGDYILSESNHCGEVSDTITISYLSPPPIVDLGPDRIICPGDSVVLSAPLTTDLITWQDGSHGTSFLADQNQTYTLQLSNQCGTTTDDFLLTIDTSVPLIDLPAEISLCPDDIITLNVTQPFMADYLWNDGSVLPTIQINTPGLYSVTILTNCNTAGHQLDIIERDTCSTNDEVFIPNVFSPNGDGINDLFEITFGPDLEPTGVNCSIYDRWGNLVYNTKVEPVQWDGTLRENQMNQAVFTYVLHIDYIAEGEERSRVFSGSVTLIR